MSPSPQKALVRRAEAPPVPFDYRLDLTRRTVAGYLAVAFGAGLLLFLSGMAIGIRVNQDLAVSKAPAAVEAPAAEVPAAAAPEGGP